MSENTDAHLPSSHRLATSLGVVPHDLQLKKASFFGDDEVLDEPELVAKSASTPGLNQSLSFLAKKDTSWSADANVWLTSAGNRTQLSVARQDAFHRSALFSRKEGES